MNNSRDFLIRLNVWEPMASAPFSCSFPVCSRGLEPVHEVDDMVIAMLDSNRSVPTKVAAMNMEQRRELAERFSKEIAEYLVHSLARHDTKNGDPI